MVRFASSLLLASLSAAVAWAANTCSADNKCPADKPCCSQYGECGAGTHCLGGCDPLSSYTLRSCAAAPVCKSKTYNWNNLNGTSTINTKYLGDASKSDWVYSGKPQTKDGNLVLTMAPNTVGTLMANNHYIWYGKVSGKVKSSRGKGVVTAFILLSDNKDEIDFEWVGADLGNVQTNYYFQGIPDWNNGVKESVNGSTFDTWHTYEIDWKPDYIKWSIDGHVQRTLNKNSTWNATSNRYQFPQTPSRLQMSLWPAGTSSSAQGTIDWAGGLVDWNNTDIQKYGYYYATFSNITVQCYSPPRGANVSGSKSYIYTNSQGLNKSIAITNNNTVLSSPNATGTNTSAGAGGGRKPGHGGHGGGGSKNDQKNHVRRSDAPILNEPFLQSSLFAAFGVMILFVVF